MGRVKGHSSCTGSASELPGVEAARGPSCVPCLFIETVIKTAGLFAMPRVEIKSYLTEKPLSLPSALGEEATSRIGRD